MERLFQGSCHCGTVRFEARGDLDEGTSRCNCSWCRKVRSWGVRMKPDSLRITQGEGDLGRYSFEFDERRPEHCFCSKCGAQLFGRGHVPELGGDFLTVQISALDDASIEEIVAASVIWCDGLHDNWWNPPEEIRHL